MTKKEMKNKTTKKTVKKVNLSPDFSKEVLQKIKTGEVEMKPRTHFILASMLTGVGLAGALFVATIFSTVAFYHLRIHQPQQFLLLGRLGARPLLSTLPLISILLVVIGFATATRLLKKYDLSYKTSFAGLVLGSLTLVLTFGFLLDKAGINEKLRRQPGLNLDPIYQEKFANHDWLMGQIYQLENRSMELVTPQGQTITLTWSRKTRMPTGETFKVGQVVRAVGEWQGEQFTAKGLVVGDKPLPSIKPKRSPDFRPNRIR